MKIFKKKETVIEDYHKKETDGAQVWMVSWDARYDSYMHDKKRVAKAFLSEEDARKFEASLYEAKSLLQYTESLDIRVEKQK